MHYKTLLALHLAQDAPGNLAPVVALARAFTAHIDALVLDTVSPIPTMTYALGPDVAWSESFGEVIRHTDERADAVRKYLDGESVDADVKAETLQLGLVDDTIATAALCTDLVIAPGSASLVTGLLGSALEGALFKAGKPVLVLGRHDAAPPIEPSEAMIAWDGGREAARAVHESLPFLQQATTVRAMIIEEQGHASELERSVQHLSRYLARHGVEIEIDRVAPAGRYLAHAFVEHVTRRSPELLVMGAYGHTRIRERLFSGATRAALTELETPLFLAH